MDDESRAETDYLDRKRLEAVKAAHRAEDDRMKQRLHRIRLNRRYRRLQRAHIHRPRCIPLSVRRASAGCRESHRTRPGHRTATTSRAGSGSDDGTGEPGPRQVATRRWRP